jgi:hypothetical protein
MSHPYTGQKKIKELIYRILEPTLEQQGWYLSKLIMNWESIIGPKWKDDIWPTRYAPNFQDRSTGTLHVKVTHAGMLQVQFTKGFLIELFNMYLGCTAIEDIKAQLWHNTQIQNITTTTTQPFDTPEKPIIDKVKDQDLKEALEDLGYALLSKRKIV